MKIKSIHPSPEKQDPFKKFLEDSLPIVDNPTQITSTEITESEIIDSTSVIMEDVAVESLQNTEENQIISLDEATYSIIDISNDKVLIENLDIYSAILFTSHFMIVGFSIKVLANDYECFAYLAEKEQYANINDFFTSKVVDCYHLMIKNAILLNKHSNVLTHYKAKELVMSQNISYEDALQAVKTEDTQSILKQQQSVSQAMPGLIIKKKGD